VPLAGLTTQWRTSIPQGRLRTGFKFGAYNEHALLEKIREALYFYGQPQAWQIIQRNGMYRDSSWVAAAKKYLELYETM